MKLTSLSATFLSFVATASTAAIVEDDPQVPTATDKALPSRAGMQTFTTLSVTDPTCYSETYRAQPSAVPLKKDSCTFLLKTHLPSIMQVNQEGAWDGEQEYSWDLGSSYPEHPNDDCVLALRAWNLTETVTFAPSVFLDVGRLILESCPQYGGVRLLGEFPLSSWAVYLYSRW